jgi:serine/threonine protein kinase
LPLPLARRVDEVCCRFEAAWKAVACGGQPPRLEDYLGDVTEPARAALLRELIQIEAHHRRQAGDELRGDDYRDRLPDLNPDWLATLLARAEPRGRPHGADENRERAGATTRRVPRGTRPTPAGADGKTESTSQFLDALWRSGLLDPQQALALDQADLARQPDDLAAWLVARGWLTTYQARRLLAIGPACADELTLGGYRLLEPLGEGGMGQVFKARHTLMNRVVAVKLIHPDLVNDPAAVQRFRVEIQAAAQLNHPNVVVAHDAEESGGRHYLVMEFCEGMTLRRLVEKSGPLPVGLACEYMRQSALGLQHAHERGLIHRDLKPGNLMLCGLTVKILDFGVARLRRGDGPISSDTKEGTIVGTPDFMAPEQSEGRPDIRSDLYSLGCTFYFLLTGQVPFPSGGLFEKYLRHKSKEPEPLGRQRPDVPHAVQQIVGRLMAKTPGERFQTAAEVADALASFAHLGPAPSVPDREEGEGQLPTMESPVEYRELPTVITPRPPRRGRRWVAVSVGVALMAGLVCLIIFLAMRYGSGPGPREQRPPSAKSWRKVRTLPIPPEQASAYGLAFSPDGRWLAAAFGNNEDNGPNRPGHVRVWEVESWRVDLDRKVESGPATCVAFSPDGKRLAWGSGNWNRGGQGHVTLWDLAEGKARSYFEAHPRGVGCLAFQPRGDLLATGGLEGKVRLWDGRWGAARGELKNGKAPVGALAFSPDGEQLVSGSDDGSVDLWEVSTSRSLGPLSEAPGKPVRGLVFVGDGRTILGVTKRGEGSTADLLAWDWRDRRSEPAIPVGETEAYCLALSPDGAIFVAGCQNKSAKLYAVSTRRELQTLSVERAILCVAFSPDGRYLATSGGWYGPVQLWERAE